MRRTPVFDGARIDTRTFVQRFGTHCPFCGAVWSSENRCGPREPGDYTIHDSLRLLFAGPPRTPPPPRHGNRHRWVTKTCAQCGGSFDTQKKGGRFCSISCGNRNRWASGPEREPVAVSRDQ